MNFRLIIALFLFVSLIGVASGAYNCYVRVLEFHGMQTSVDGIIKSGDWYKVKYQVGCYSDSDALNGFKIKYYNLGYDIQGEGTLSDVVNPGQQVVKSLTLPATAPTVSSPTADVFYFDLYTLDGIYLNSDNAGVLIVPEYENVIVNIGIVYGYAMLSSVVASMIAFALFIMSRFGWYV